MAEARALYPGKPYRVNTDLGELVMLPPQLADEIRNQPNLNFSKAVYNRFHGGIPGFEPATLSGETFQLLILVVQKHLTKLLGMLCFASLLSPFPSWKLKGANRWLYFVAKVTEPLSEETGHALSINLGNSTGYKLPFQCHIRSQRSLTLDN